MTPLQSVAQELVLPHWLKGLAEVIKGTEEFF
ncbi:hypothetical protein AVDCRST_MAG94-3109, partial [uncultured Leptolyngbya sp.]